MNPPIHTTLQAEPVLLSPLLLSAVRTGATFMLSRPMPDMFCAALVFHGAKNITSHTDESPAVAIATVEQLLRERLESQAAIPIGAQ